MTQLLNNELDAGSAPDLAKLPDGYVFGEMPGDDAPEKALPKERVNIYCMFEAGEASFEYIVAIGARNRKRVDDSVTKVDDVIPKKQVGDNVPVVDAKVAATRSRLIQKLADSVADYITKSGAKIELLEIRASDRENAAPWAAIELAHRAAREINSRRAKASQAELTIRLPFEFRLIIPPTPEQPPGVLPQVPRDDDERIPKGAPDKPAPDEGERVPPGGGEGRSGPAGQGKPHAVFAGRPTKTGGENADRIEAALNWLRDHQNPAGYWSGAAFREDGKRPGAGVTANLEFVKPGDPSADGGWKDTTDIGLTALALMAFAGAGETHKEGPYKGAIRNAVIYLRSAQDNNGCFGAQEKDHFVYNHAMATTALAELYALTGDPLMRPMLSLACKFILNAQNPGLGWRYGVRDGTNDSSVTGWMVLALQTARWAEIDIGVTESFADAFRWFDGATAEVKGRLKTGYDHPGSNNARLRSAGDYDNNATLDALHGALLHLTGRADPKSRTLAGFADAVSSETSQWEKAKIDYYCWFWAAMFLRQHDANLWNTWKTACSNVLLDHQRGFHARDVADGRTTPKTLSEHGSWDAVDAWSQAGGRVYATAMGALILSTEGRHARVAELPK